MVLKSESIGSLTPKFLTNNTPEETQHLMESWWLKPQSTKASSRSYKDSLVECVDAFMAPAVSQQLKLQDAP